MKDGKHVILCVDDDSDVLDVLKVVLEKNGYVYQGASSAEEGLRRFKETDPDLIIVDLMMEEIDAGTNLVKDLKLAGCKKPIFMLSSLGDQLHLTADTSSLGLTGVFQKPVQPDILVKTLKSKLG